MNDAEDQAIADQREEAQFRRYKELVAMRRQLAEEARAAERWEREKRKQVVDYHYKREMDRRAQERQDRLDQEAREDATIKRWAAASDAMYRRGLQDYRQARQERMDERQAKIDAEMSQGRGLDRTRTGLEIKRLENSINNPKRKTLKDIGPYQRQAMVTAFEKFYDLNPNIAGDKQREAVRDAIADGMLSGADLKAIASSTGSIPKKGKYALQDPGLRWDSGRLTEKPRQSQGQGGRIVTDQELQDLNEDGKVDAKDQQIKEWRETAIWHVQNYEARKAAGKPITPQQQAIYDESKVFLQRFQKGLSKEYDELLERKPR